MTEFNDRAHTAGAQKAEKEKKAGAAGGFSGLKEQLKRVMTETVGHRLKTKDRLEREITQIFSEIETLLFADSDTPRKLPVSMRFDNPRHNGEAFSAYWSSDRKAMSLRATTARTSFTQAQLDTVQFEQTSNYIRDRFLKAFLLVHQRPSMLAFTDFPHPVTQENSQKYLSSIDLGRARNLSQLLAILKRVKREITKHNLAENDAHQVFDLVHTALTELSQQLDQEACVPLDEAGRSRSKLNFSRQDLAALHYYFKERTENVFLFGGRIKFTQDLVGKYGILLANSFVEEDIADNSIFPVQALSMDNWYQLAVEYFPSANGGPRLPKTARFGITDGGRKAYDTQYVVEFDELGNITSFYEPLGSRIKRNLLENHDYLYHLQPLVTWLTEIALNPSDPRRE